MDSELVPKKQIAKNMYRVGYPLLVVEERTGIKLSDLSEWVVVERWQRDDDVSPEVRADLEATYSELIPSLNRKYMEAGNAWADALSNYSGSPEDVAHANCMSLFAKGIKIILEQSKLTALREPALMRAEASSIADSIPRPIEHKDEPNEPKEVTIKEVKD